MKFSALFSLNFQDLLKGAIMAGGGAAYAILEPLITSGNFVFDWPMIIKTSIGTAVIYLLKNFLTPEPKAIVIDPGRTEIKTK